MLRVFPSWQDNGSRAFHDEGGKLVAVVPARFVYGSVIDYREPPFEQTSPCIYCGALDDRGHDPTLHVNHSLGMLSR